MKRKIIFMLGVLAISAFSGKINAFTPTNETKIKKAIVQLLPEGAGSGYLTGQTAKFKADCDLYGFHIDEQWYPYNRQTFTVFTDPVYEKQELQYQTDIQQVLLQNANNFNIFSVVYRIVTSPVGTRHNGGFLGIGGYGDTWYTRKVRTYTKLGSAVEIGQWAPKNEYATYTGTIGVGFGSSGYSISTSVAFTISQLTVTSKTNVATSSYETIYNISGENDYNRNSAEYKGFFTFVRDSYSLTPLTSLNHAITYYGAKHYKNRTLSYIVSL